MTTYYSKNDEDYNYDDPRDAIDDLMGIEPKELIIIYEGELVAAKASKYAPDIEDHLANNAYDDVGECSDVWPSCDEYKMAELQSMVEDAIDSWADKHGLQPKFGEIRNIKQLTYKLNAKGKDAEDIESDDYELVGTTAITRKD